MSTKTPEEAKRLFREAYQNLSTHATSIDVIRCVDAKQNALTAGVSIRELQAIEDEIGRQQPHA